LGYKLLLKGIFEPALFRPKAAASASTAEPSNLARTSGRWECFGSQVATKSPPGPNLQSGSACFSLSRIIFLFRIVSRASCPRSEGGTPSTRFFKFVQSQMFYRQGVLIYPNKNRTKISRFRTFFSPLSFYSDSRKNMGLRVEYFHSRSSRQFHVDIECPDRSSRQRRWLRSLDSGKICAGKRSFGVKIRLVVF